MRCYEELGLEVGDVSKSAFYSVLPSIKLQNGGGLSYVTNIESHVTSPNVVQSPMSRVTHGISRLCI